MLLKNQGSRGWKGFNDLCDLVSFTFFRAASLIIQKSPELMNSAKEDGFSALHLASLNGHYNVVECLVQVNVCLTSSQYFWLV